MTTTTTVTVLFTDLVDSTRLLTQLGHATYEILRTRHWEALRAVIANHRGIEVKNTGDGLMLRFGSAADAVACSIGLQQATERLALSEVAPLQLRVGIAIGEATVDETDVFGRPVNEAARLCSEAEAGQILVSDAVRWVANGRTAVSGQALEARTLKGLPEPVPLFDVHWDRPSVDGSSGTGASGYLVEVRPPDAPGFRISVTQPTEVGRQGAAVQVDDPRLSRRHLLLDPRPEGLVAQDLGSTNGTRLNDQPLVEPSVVIVGDILRLGASTLTIMAAPARSNDERTTMLGDRTTEGFRSTLGDST